MNQLRDHLACRSAAKAETIDDPPTAAITVQARPATFEAFQITEANQSDCAEWPQWAMDAWNKGLTDPTAPGALHVPASGRFMLTVPTYGPGEARGFDYEVVTAGDWLLFRGWDDMQSKPIERLNDDSFHRMYMVSNTGVA